jgi:hypothetical protein
LRGEEIAALLIFKLGPLLAAYARLCSDWQRPQAQKENSNQQNSHPVSLNEYTLELIHTGAIPNRLARQHAQFWAASRVELLSIAVKGLSGHRHVH